MLIDERTALIYMALQARRIGIEGALRHAGVRDAAGGTGERPVRIVTIRTLHEAFVHPVMRGHLKLRADIRVAAVASLILFLGQQKLRRGRMMNGVTTGAGNAVERMLAALDIRFAHIGRVAGETILHYGFRLH